MRGHSPECKMGGQVEPQELMPDSKLPSFQDAIMNLGGERSRQGGQERIHWHPALKGK
jgi:hypothetical protein